jgi:hypothetical protein
MQKKLIILLALSILLFANTSFTEETGCIKGDCKNGAGITVFLNGSRFEGEFKNGNIHGQGRFIYADGSIYTGGFKDGRRNGRGLYTDSQGTQYSGKFIDDKFQGQDDLQYRQGKNKYY